MTLRLNTLRLCFALLCLAAGTSVCADTSKPGLSLRSAMKTEFDPARLMSFCKAQSPACNPATTQVFVLSKGDDGFIYLIDASKPMLIRWPKRATAQTASIWNFADHVHSFQSLANEYIPSDFKLQTTEIYPALYRVDTQTFAIALTQSKHVMYSGGGGLDVLADFVVLETHNTEANTLAFKPLYQGVPFSSSALTRACFSVKEYADEKHGRRRICHDQQSAHVRLAYNRSTTTHGPWRFTWHTYYQSSEDARQDVKRHIPFDVAKDEDLQTQRQRLSHLFVNK